MSSDRHQDERMEEKLVHKSVSMEGLLIRVKRPKAIIIDIEGTTTSVRFYPSIVAPYITNNTENYLKTHWHKDHVQSIIRDLREAARQKTNIPKILDERQSSNNHTDVQKSALIHIESLYKRNTNNLALLYFQMYIWLDGQTKGMLKTHLFEDVARCLHQWRVQDKIAIYIYSSARADVQMLMFACTEYGSMLHLIDGHFDSKIGPKTAPETYNKIAQSIQRSPQNIIFLTDDLKEAKPAKNSGFKVLLVKREKRIYSPIEASQFEIVSSFDKIKFFD